VVYWQGMRRGLLASALAVVLIACAAPRPGAAQASQLPARGGADAKVVIMVFADLSSPETAKATGALTTVLRDFPKDVQVLFKHNPAADSAAAELAHEAVVEAARQGKFWEMHDRLLAHQGELKPADLAAHAKALGLDATAFEAALQAHTHRAAVGRDVAEARALGIEGPFVLYINGRRGAGAPPAGALGSLVKNLLAGGDGSGPPPVPANTFDLTGAPIRGAADAPVTLVMFSDFQCGFCLRVNPTVTQLLQRYPGKVRVAFKHFPIEGHDAAPLAHRAAMAAQAQGKFWEMHDRIFANQRAMSRDDLIAHATALGLDVPRFTAALDAPAATALLERNHAEGEALGVDGTPTFFVNGTPLVGAQPLEAFAAAVDKALATVH
jgi:protein-disulfide isomerase